MPLVLTQNEKSAATVVYNDRLGKSYEFPTQYQKLVRPGEQFVYYRGKRSASGRIQIPHYFGAGVVGAVTPAGDELLRCEVMDYRAFNEKVPFKRDGRYLEPGANGRVSREVGLHFRTGVRTIDQGTFNAIVSAAGLSPEATTKKVGTKRVEKKRPSASGKNTKDELYDLATALANLEAKAQWPSATIFRAPAGQYFSLIIRHSDGKTHHIAVKATEDDEPRIYLSAGEITYSDRHAANYSLWVFYAMNLRTGTGKLIKRTGRITDDDIDLRSVVHGGRLKDTKASKTVGPILG
ncbi:hypothetical protein A5725_13560 [Mycobacterium kubicae]|uniref:hypothetical protein n=1 Tax=Mycobacterium kubicae TaxID=120959 RepID=UPI0007FF51C0|nr:hypothetical protein [Mycobacterium kubicae]OBF21615.1 hypothetical protein A5725_13560 [Mycobacterium kubicae]